MAISKKEQDKIVFMTKRDAQGNIIVTKASGHNGGEIRGSILRTNEGNPYLVAGKGISILSGSNSGYPKAGQVTLEIDLGSITEELKSAIVASGLSGMVGPQGPTGPAGSAGSAGTEGKAGDAGSDGEEGARGVGITSITFNDDATLRIIYGEDDDHVDTDSLMGPQGTGISNIEIDIPEDSDDEAYLIFTLDVVDDDGLPVELTPPENIKGPRGIGLEPGDNFTTRFSFRNGEQFGAKVAYLGEYCEETWTGISKTAESAGDRRFDDTAGHGHTIVSADDHTHDLTNISDPGGHTHTHEFEIETTTSECKPIGEIPFQVPGDMFYEELSLPQLQKRLPCTAVTMFEFDSPIPTGIQNMDIDIRLVVVGESLVARPFSSTWPAFNDDLVAPTYLTFRLQEFTEEPDVSHEDWPGTWDPVIQWSDVDDSTLNYIENDFDAVDWIMNGGLVDMPQLCGSIRDELINTSNPIQYTKYMKPFTTYTSLTQAEFTALKNKHLRMTLQLAIGGYVFDWASHHDGSGTFPLTEAPEDADQITNLALFNVTMGAYNLYGDAVWLHIHDVFFDIKYTVPEE